MTTITTPPSSAFSPEEEARPGRPVAVQYCATFLKPEMLHVYRQISGLEGWKPVVFTQKREGEASFPFSPIVRVPRPWSRALRRMVVRQWLKRPVMIYRSEARWLSREVERVGAAVVHIYFGHIAVQLLPFLRQSPVPVVVSFHGADAMVDMEKPAYRRATLEMMERARLVLVRSRSLAARIEALGCPADKIRIHRTGIPLEHFPFVARQAPPDGAWRFFQACRLIPKKGLRTTLRAFAAFAAAYPRATLRIAGEGPMLAELQTLAGELGIGSQVEFSGFLSQERLREELYAAHAFLHPSEVGADGNQEGVPNSMLEAMSTGLPVLATYHGGIPEAVEHGETGFLVQEGDWKALRAAMFCLVRPRGWGSADSTGSTAGSESEPGALERLGLAGRELPDFAAMGAQASASVAARFEQRRQIAVLEACYEEARTQAPSR